MNRDLDVLTWPISRLGEAIEALARRSGLSPSIANVPNPSEEIMPADDEGIGRWLDATVSRFDLEAEPTETTYADVESLIYSAGPALLRLPDEGQPCVLALLQGQRGSAQVLAPDLTIRRASSERIREQLYHDLEAPIRAEIDELLKETDIPTSRQERVRTAILADRLSMVHIRGCWLLRLSPSTSFLRQAQHANIPRHLLSVVGTHGIQYMLWLLSWYLIGRGALSGRIDIGWLWAWALTLLAIIPFQLLTTRTQGQLAIRAGGILKAKLLYGILKLEPDEIRHQGVGGHLGRVIESEAVESLALSGGFLGLTAAIEMIMATIVLNFGIGKWLHLGFLMGCLAVAAVMGWRYFQRREEWTQTRLGITNGLVERMVGHRTRLLQGRFDKMHQEEDRVIEHYLNLSTVTDRIETRLIALIPRGWLILGLLGFIPAFVQGNSTPANLAISLGGVLLAYRAFSRLTEGLVHISWAAIAWREIRELFNAASRPENLGISTLAPASRNKLNSTDDKPTLIDAHNLVFRYQDRGEPILRGCHLRIYSGDRILLEGSSGGGKSTLASLLIGLRQPESGLLLLHGLDSQTLGVTGWQERVVSAPQFHENHVLTETFAFNLLMGRRSPLQLEDFQEAEAICRELGLGELLDRMPAGMLQMVGESGWQLSHGEKSRLYIARALLQDADLVVLDESFAALDPENLHRALQCVLNRASTLLVIAHP